jgi:hypothetical protein
VTYPLEPWLAEEYEWLDMMKMKGTELADQACRKLYMGGVPWCPVLQGLRDALGYWQLVVKKKLGRKVSSRLIEQM